MPLCVRAWRQIFAHGSRLVILSQNWVTFRPLQQRLGRMLQVRSCTRKNELVHKRKRAQAEFKKTVGSGCPREGTTTAAPARFSQESHCAPITLTRSCDFGIDRTWAFHQKIWFSSTLSIARCPHIGWGHCERAIRHASPIFTSTNVKPHLELHL